MMHYDAILTVLACQVAEETTTLLIQVGIGSQHTFHESSTLHQLNAAVVCGCALLDSLLTVPPKPTR
ncbi:uncharacterized protein MEPE_05635 [Melanopsichium pennsylvanicum]|uniref:Uncharacterized protein n=1 Tax=Melanopsichium pennsylvanicum TaxID=63383 RepID=A0AAJ5C7I0_9BASI|nr:uncharacterized protein MEPE_05635 [Melanopsichium pennsylvanicum]